ncbi:MAG: ribonuclease HII [Candidatus Omnitrophica bacterium]|nr:ribonuclease HII [Candidatus Omnitrophota bacterium]
MYRFEEALRKDGFRIIAGTDEAGRGPLAGPVVAACVILPDFHIPGINDSKMLSEKKREKLFAEIMSSATVGVSVISESVIDEINIYQASRLAMKKAFHELSLQPDFLLIDGPLKLDVFCKTKSIIKGDRKSASIAAASIIAKVTRDRLMREYHEEYPEYDFARHKGYPTKRHRELLKLHGPSPIHRRSFRPVRDLVFSDVV